MRLPRRLVLAPAVVAVVTAASAALAAPAGAPADVRGSTIQVVRPAGVAFNANQSTNWFGYNLGAAARRQFFRSIAATWTVPTATQHRSGQAEHSSTWIGIGGGCVTANCTVGDNTLIQTGTEQSVSASGSASYSTWWELIPGPAITAPLVVHPGDRVRGSIAEGVRGVWTIRLTNLTTGKGWQRTVPYSSTYATAEFIEETPIVVGTGGTGFAALPNLTKTTFDNALVNGRNPRLKASEQIQLVSGSSVIGTPSAPQADGDGFGACAWATSCSVPGEL